MPGPASPDGADKVARRRARQRARGMELIRLSAPDPARPGFRDEARRQAALLRDAPEQEDALDVIEAVADLDDWTE